MPKQTSYTYKHLDIKTAQQLFLTKMQQDFPQDELKPFSLMEKKHREGFYHFIGCYDQDTLLGYAFIAQAKTPDVLLLDYFAILKTERGKGIGHLFIQALPTLFSKSYLLLAEVEAPRFAKNSADLQQRTRRLKFYESLGFSSSQLSLSLFKVPLDLLFFSFNKPLQNISADEITAFLLAIYHNLFGIQTTKKEIQIFSI